jgi:hypothetical protein
LVLAFLASPSQPIYAIPLKPLLCQDVLAFFYTFTASPK